VRTGSLPSPAPNEALEATGHSAGFVLSAWVGGAVARASPWAFGTTIAKGGRQNSLRITGSSHPEQDGDF